MRRRDILALAGGAVALHPLKALPQPMPVIGFLSSRSASDSGAGVAAFRRGLSEAGYDEDRNVSIEFRWAEGRYDRLPGLAVELVERHVAVLVAVGGEPAAMSAKAATVTIPIVFSIGGDPTGLGLAATYHRPGGNATGISLLPIKLLQQEIFRCLAPRVQPPEAIGGRNGTAARH